jgi:hypothetical protein
MVRGSLVTSIYRKTLQLGTNQLEESAAVTLMSTDVEQVMVAFEDMHEVWANIAQIGLAVWLLEQEVSWACVAPIIISLGQSYHHFRARPGRSDCASSLCPCVRINGSVCGQRAEEVERGYSNQD